MEYLVRGFRERGYDVDVLTWKLRPDDAAFLARSATIVDGRRGPVTTITLCVHFSYTASPFSWAGVRMLAKDAAKFVLGFLIVRGALRRLHPDIVYLNEYSVAQASLAAWSAGIPAVTHVRSPILRGTFGLRRRALCRLLLRSNRKIFAITRREAEQLHPATAERPKIRIMGEFVPAPGREKTGVQALKRGFGIPRSGIVVAMLGGIKPFKGTLEYLRAAKFVREMYPRSLFVLAGSDLTGGSAANAAYYEECQRAAESLKAGGALLMLGEITTPLSLIRVADILVSPSPQTHFSRPVIEAWRAGKPVVAARTPHMEECITDGKDGLLCAPGDERSLAACIIRLAGNPRLRAALGRAGAKKAAAKFDAERNLDAIVAECDELIRRP